MSELVALCNALDRAVQPLPALAGNLQQRAARLKSLAVEVQVAAREVPRGPDCSRIAANLYEAAHGLEASASALSVAVQQGRAYVQRTVGGAAEGGAGPPDRGISGPTSTESVLARTLAGMHDSSGRGLSLVHVDRLDFSDNPILGYRASAPPEDVAYAVTMWNEQIAPGIAAGATREDFAAYDHEHGLVGHQSLAGVYDFLTGEEAVWSGGVRPDGRFEVGGGRHRIEQARLNGVDYLPVRLRFEQ